LRAAFLTARARVLACASHSRARAAEPAAAAVPRAAECGALRDDTHGLWDSAPLPEVAAAREAASARGAHAAALSSPPSLADDAAACDTPPLRVCSTSAAATPAAARPAAPERRTSGSSERDDASALRRLASSAGELAGVAADADARLRSAHALVDGLDVADAAAAGDAGGAPAAPAAARRAEREQEVDSAPPSAGCGDPPAAAAAAAAPPLSRALLGGPFGGPVRPSVCGALRARVIGSSVRGDAFSTHVAYDILVSDAHTGARWLVQRRFSNFEALHKRVKALRARGRYKLPPKRLLFHGTEGGFMDTRKELLDVYLQDMLSDARLCACAELWDFLSAQSRSYVPAPGGGGVLKSVSLGLSAGLDCAVGRVSTGVRGVRAELADASRRFDRKLEAMKERWEPRPDAEAAQPATEERGREGGDNGDDDDGAAPRDAAVRMSAGQLLLRSAAAAGGGGSSLSLSMASSSAAEEEGYASSSDSADGHSPAAGCAQDAQDASDAASDASLPPPPPAAAAYSFSTGVGDAASCADAAGLSLPLLDLADAIFRLRDKGWVQRRMLSFARGVAELFIGGAVDEALAAKLAALRRGDTLARATRALRETLWPGGVWYRTRIAAAARAAGVEPPPTAPLGFGGVPPGREAEAAEEARAVRALLLQRSSGVALAQLVGRDAFRRGTLEVYHLLQSPLFVRQIGHTLLEALLVRSWLCSAVLSHAACAFACA
jgi:hypothetical protein